MKILFITVLCIVMPHRIQAAKRNPFAYAYSSKDAYDISHHVENKESYNEWRSLHTIATATGSITIMHDAQGNVRTVKIEQKKALQLE